MLKVVALLVMSLCAFGPAYAAIYKWVDENGVVTFMDTPPPEEMAAEEVDPEPFFFDNHEPEGEQKASTAPKPKVQRTLVKKGEVRKERTVILPKSYPPVEIYTTRWCPACNSAKEYLRALDVPFREYDVEKSRSAAARMKRLASGNGVPLTVIGSIRIKGFRPRAFEKALGIRRVRNK